ncbi:50S ribosomal protein L3 N(5)-glutamine methyltransferase [Enterobacteriaceae endosymbiont of Neohaemonia nigricornis]|uniref:50S ribosomal protein L3 N(5)-glutamine methyltransferase n=1 Tax=Enterobacteriaceae endosymbiont of Neohaemonia nigricornis TaxID=2675792 RepID=UPI001449EA88|nr:50S ribosomal protein L3 N(5)-glutamine methyltransferase [Enterobacteriaceae endosymbiont of Neohaemonia nigricornis]QJC30355.1 50S ribosomal protein L3 N(5)-glutamine methyltransferase [Enterobacteriaceae endosymbiont of Neohaemonia nigricornis]
MTQILSHVLHKDILNELSTIQDMTRWATTCFNISDIWYGHGNLNPWDEAIQLILPILGLPPYLWNKIYQSKLIYNERKLIYNKVYKRITKHIPVSYLTNKAWFCGHELYIDNRTLIPRSPIAELINNNFNNIIFNKPKYILDLCTGSGCIAIACAYLFPDAHIDAVDISINAINVAEHNIYLHGLEHHITPIYSNLFDNLHIKHYDLIISNPPYIDKKDIKYLPKEYLYEPVIGLVSKNKGLDIIYKIINQSYNFLSTNGILICEVGNKKTKVIKKYMNIDFEWLDITDNNVNIFKLNRNQLKI